MVGEKRVKEVLNALSSIRVNIIDEEYTLQRDIAEILKASDIEFKKEYYLGPKNRVDFMLKDGVVIEIKKGKPNKKKVIDQLKRYTSFECVSAVILVVETGLDIPKEINSKPCVSLGLSKLWGIAL